MLFRHVLGQLRSVHLLEHPTPSYLQYFSGHVSEKLNDFDVWTRIRWRRYWLAGRVTRSQADAGRTTQKLSAECS
eukprot:g29621.t1